MNSVIKDTLAGALMFGGLSYLSDRFHNKSYYFKIVAFAWAAPFTYFYLLYITSRAGKKSLDGFNTHALIGTLATAFLILLYMFLKDKMDIKHIITIIFLLTFIFTFGYYHFKIFEKV
tara:strand:+ start:965 stop:1318 length:354 start_codon:yes stop_codon:yes gene_type:complete